MCSATSSSSPSGALLPFFMYARHASVVIVNPAGTGTPSCVISASPMPLPPRSSRPPSAGSSKAYTYRVTDADLVIDSSVQTSQIVGLGASPDEAMLDHVLGLARGRRVLYVPTAANEDPGRTVEWYARLRGLAELTPLFFYPWPPADLRD